MDTITESPDWSLLQTFLPADWEDQGRWLGAFARARQVRSPSALLRLVLVVCGVGLSYQRTAEVAELGGFGELSKVSLWHRLQRCGPWLEWLMQSLLGAWIERPEPRGYRPLAVDGSIVAGPKAKVQVRLHYVLDLLTLRPAQVRVTGIKEGEGLAGLTVCANELWIGDRGFARVNNVARAQAGGADVLVRLGRRTLRLYDDAGEQVDLLVRCRQLQGYTPGWSAVCCETPDGGRTAGRLVLVRLSPAAVAQAQRRTRRTEQRKQRKVAPETAELAGYLCLFTTASAERLSETEVLDWYRARWQVELAFKRLKSLLKASELRATTEARARVWLLGKMLYALLLHACLDQAAAFSPWGYPLPRDTARVADPLRSGLGADPVDESGDGGRPVGLFADAPAGLAQRGTRRRRRTLPAQPAAADAGVLAGGEEGRRCVS